MNENNLDSTDLPQEHADFYRKFRKRVTDWEAKKGDKYKWLEYVVLAPDMFYLLVKLSLDSEVPVKHKALLLFGTGYFISPIDLIPDFIPVVGLLDDVAVGAFVLNVVINQLDPEIVKRHWVGDGDILEHVKRIIDAADEMIGKGLVQKIVKLVKSKLK